MARSNVDTLSYKDLLALSSEIEDAVAARKIEEARAVRSQLAELASAKGFSIEELFGKSRKTGKVAVKFRNPKDGAQTWMGRGRKPLWLVAALKKGAKMETFAV